MRRRIALAGAGMVATVGYWAWAQPAAQPMAAIFPAGALVYTEARDFGALVADWNGSVEKRAWLGSADYQAFSRSHLFLKLGEKQKEFAAAAGVPADYALVSSVAGGDSALGIYNIGELEFLYVTRLAAARAMDTALWKARGNYQTRNAGGVAYYVKIDAGSHRTAAFAYAGDLLLLATREDLMAGALELIARGARPAVRSEKWFANATQAAQAAQAGPSDLRMVYNLDRLRATPQFRSYWVQRNAGELGKFTSGIADLEIARGEIRERRSLVRANPAAAVQDEAASAKALAMVPDDAGFYRARLAPAADQVELAMENQLFAAGRTAAVRTKQAPVVANDQPPGSEQDLETRIDEAPLVIDRDATVFAGLKERMGAMRVEAMLEVASTRVDADQVYVGSQRAIALVGQSDWDADAIRGALAAAAGSFWGNGTSGAWRAEVNGVQELEGLGQLAIAIDGRLLVAGNSAEMVSAVFSRRSRTGAAGGAVYAAGWRHARELPNFERMMRMIDFPQIPPAGEGANAREPMFYSENIASLGRALARVDTATIMVHDAGTMLHESVEYRIAP